MATSNLTFLAIWKIPLQANSANETEHDPQMKFPRMKAVWQGADFVGWVRCFGLNATLSACFSDTILPEMLTMMILWQFSYVSPKDNAEIINNQVLENL